MKKLSSIIAMALIASSSYATNDGGKPTAPNLGGSGGQGGTSMSTSGSVAVSGSKSSIDNKVKNDVKNSVRQGQGQDQNQKQSQSNRQTQSSKSVSQGGKSSSTSNGGSSSAYGGTTNSLSSTSESNNSNQSVQLNDAKGVANTAYAAMIAPTAVCSGASSGGAQGASFGVSFGTSWTDDNCMLLEQVRTVAVVLGDRSVAEEMLCGMDAYREARIRTDRPCKSSPKTRSTAESKPEYTDPIIRHRLGLPPL